MAKFTVTSYTIDGSGAWSLKLLSRRVYSGNSWLSALRAAWEEKRMGADRVEIGWN